MSSAVTWVLNNKDWLFSGLGIVVAGWVLKFLYSKSYGTKKFADKVTQTASGSSQIAVSGQIHTQGGDVHIHNSTTTNHVPAAPIGQGAPLPKKLSNVTPSEIQKKLSSASPFQKASIGEHYIGLRVKWNAKFFSIARLGASNKKKNYQVHLDPEVALIFFVKGTIDIDDFPELKVAEKDASLTVEGLIESVDEMGVYLNIEDIVLSKK